jgi:lipoprotein NlpI
MRPNLARALIGRAQAYLDLDDDDLALKDFDAALKLEPRQIDALLGRAQLHADAGQPQRAAADFDAALAVDAKNIAALHGRGLARIELMQTDLALRDFDAALAVDPKSPEVLVSRGLARVDRGDYAAALADFSAAHAADPTEASPVIARGRSYMMAGEYAKAEADLALIVGAAPRDGFHALWLYLARARGGKDGKAALAAAAPQFGKEWPMPIVALALGQTSPAEVLRAAQDKNPKRQAENLCEAQYFIGQFALIAGNRAAAEQAFRAALAAKTPRFDEYRGARAELLRMGLKP